MALQTVCLCFFRGVADGRFLLKQTHPTLFRAACCRCCAATADALAARRSSGARAPRNGVLWPLSLSIPRISTNLLAAFASAVGFFQPQFVVLASIHLAPDHGCRARSGIPPAPCFRSLRPFPPTIESICSGISCTPPTYACTWDVERPLEDMLQMPRRSAPSTLPLRRRKF